MKPNLLSIAFTLIYTFAFREATKRAAEWGAFQFPSDIKGMLLKVFTSAIILLIIPVLFYSLSLKVISQHISTNESFLVDLLWMILLITLLGFFPRAAKNLWSLVSRPLQSRQRKKGWTTGRGLAPYRHRA